MSANYSLENWRDMVKRDSLGWENGASKQHQNYRISSRFESLLQHHISEHRKFLEARTRQWCSSFGADIRDNGYGQLYDDATHWSEEE